MQRIEIDLDFTSPVDRVYAYRGEHEILGRMFGAKIARVRDGDSSRNGLGPVCRLRIGILPLDRAIKPGLERTVRNGRRAVGALA